jgi:pyrroloquinoline quinone biosynthesis protein D
MVKLNGPAGEILRRCDGRSTVQQLVRDLERSFGERDLGGDVCDFLSDAYGRGWII